MHCSHGNRIVRLRLSPSAAAGGRVEVFARVLCREPASLLAELAERQNIIECGHRDGRLIRLLVGCLRSCLDEKGNVINKFIPPEEFTEWRALIAESQYWRLKTVEQLILDARMAANTIVIGYHGTLAVGRGGFSSEINFRKIDRILVSGKAKSCREVFGLFLNETRDWNMDNSRYTSRFYLTYTFLEQAFDSLAARRYNLTSSSSTTPRFSKQKNSDQENTFSHYSQYVFVRHS